MSNKNPAPKEEIGEEIQEYVNEIINYVDLSDYSSQGIALLAENIKHTLSSARTQAVEEYKKRLEEKIPKLKEYYPIGRDEFEKRDIEGKRMYNTAVQEFLTIIHETK